MAGHEVSSEGNVYTSRPNGNADVLNEISLIDSDLAQFYLELTDVLISDSGWDHTIASRFVLDWAMDRYLGEEYTLRFMDYYE